jgi:hypothetical protein
MKQNLVSILVAMAALAITHSAVAAETPSVDEIIARSLKAQGGKEVLQKIKARQMKGTVEISGAGASGALELYAQAPNKIFSKTDLTGMGVITEGFDGKVAWSKNPWEGLKEKTGDELQKARRDADFYRGMRMKELYPDIKTAGKEKVGDTEAYVLESKPSPTSAERFYFDAKTGLPVRQQSTFQKGDTEVRSTSTLGDFKAVDGVLYPHRVDVAVSAGGQEFVLTLKLSEIKHPGSVDASRFAKPPEDRKQ